ncbi:MAG: hypothetical protein LBD87_05590, partial [Prevotellaceae bacterium]|nr:hypothetical protein [Prevotellaceae bacterium]
QEGDYYAGRTQYDSPEVDGEVLVSPANNALQPGKFYDVLITAAETYDLFGSCSAPSFRPERKPPDSRKPPDPQRGNGIYRFTDLQIYRLGWRASLISHISTLVTLAHWLLPRQLKSLNL